MIGPRSRAAAVLIVVFSLGALAGIAYERHFSRRTSVGRSAAEVHEEAMAALREDLEVSHRAVTHWMDILDRLYHVFRLRPFEGRRVRSLRRMPKAYLWDWSLVPDAAARFENLVASHLLKFVHALQDVDGHDVSLFYLRDRAGHEVDFLVSFRGRPWFAVEAKLRETAIDSSLRYFRERLRIPFLYQVVLESRRDFVEDDIRCVPAADFLGSLA